MWVNKAKWHCLVPAWQLTSLCWTETDFGSWPPGFYQTPHYGSAGSSGTTILCICSYYWQHNDYIVKSVLLIIKGIVEIQSQQSSHYSPQNVKTWLWTSKEYVKIYQYIFRAQRVILVIMKNFLKICFWQLNGCIVALFHLKLTNTLMH